jgi:hypothetical protein
MNLHHRLKGIVTEMIGNLTVTKEERNVFCSNSSGYIN